MDALNTTPAEGEYAGSRRRLFERMLYLKGLCPPDSTDGNLRTLRVGDKYRHSNGFHWRDARDHLYEYRCVLPNEVAFDVGDRQPWAETRRRTHAVWRACVDLGLLFIGALSGGVGTHTHLFFDCRLCDDDPRPMIANMILDRAREYLGMGPFDETEIADTRLLHRRYGKQQIREFGSKKRNTKTVWTVNGFRKLPTSRLVAYNIAGGPAVPVDVPVNGIGSLGLRHIAVNRALGKCPTSPDCFDERDWGYCDACPVNR